MQEEARRTSLWQGRMTVSSANVPVVKFGACGRSDVNRGYSIGHRTLPWGTPDLIGNKAETSTFTLVRNRRLLRYDFNNGKNVGGFFLKFYIIVMGARPSGAPDVDLLRHRGTTHEPQGSQP